MARTSLSNEEIARRFKKMGKLRYHPLGVYFSHELPGTGRRAKFQGIVGLYNWCIVSHAFRAAKKAGTSALVSGKGCPGGQWWSGFSRVAPKGLAIFLAHGRDDVFGGRCEKFKKDTRISAGVFKEPGAVKQPPGTKYIIYQALKDIPDDVKIEFVLFFLTPDETAKLITMCHYARHVPSLVRAPGGSGCMSVLNHPLQLAEEPVPDAVLGVWDIVARRHVPRNILTLAVRRWFAEDMAGDIPGSFMTHAGPFTTRGELQLLFRKIKKKFRGRKPAKKAG